MRRRQTRWRGSKKRDQEERGDSQIDMGSRHSSRKQQEEGPNSKERAEEEGNTNPAVRIHVTPRMEVINVESPTKEVVGGTNSGEEKTDCFNMFPFHMLRSGPLILELTLHFRLLRSSCLSLQWCWSTVWSLAQISI